MKKHSIMMIIGCLVPLALIFILPLFGITGNITILIFIGAMFGCHLLMMGGHGSHKEHENTNSNNKEDINAPHQH